MKHKYISFILLLTLGLAACRKEDSYPQRIVGKWINYKQRVYTVVKGVTVYDQTYDGNSDAYYKFNNDGTGQKPVSTYESIPFTYKLTNNRIIIEYLAPLKYVVRDTFTIPELTNTTLTMHSQWSYGPNILNNDLSYKKQ